MADELFNLENLFGKPLIEITDEELIEKAEELKRLRKYPSIEKAVNSKKDKIESDMERILREATENRAKLEEAKNNE